MSQNFKTVFIAIVAALMGAGITYALQVKEAPMASELPEKFAGVVKYNCEKSAGVFENNTCICPLEEGLGQTQELMYDKSTGYCQTTYGGPAGEAFSASVGLPYGDYSFYGDIIYNNCTESGGEFLYICNCPEGKVYDKSTGFCK